MLIATQTFTYSCELGLRSDLVISPTGTSIIERIWPANPGIVQIEAVCDGRRMFVVNGAFGSSANQEASNLAVIYHKGHWQSG